MVILPDHSNREILGIDQGFEQGLSQTALQGVPLDESRHLMQDLRRRYIGHAISEQPGPMIDPIHLGTA